MKKTVVFIIAILSAAILLCSCKGGNISESKIKKDLKEKMSYITIDKIKVEKSQRIDNSDSIWIEMSFSNDDCDGKRYYILNYSYYDRGGWMLDNFCEDRISDWTAHPKKMITHDKDFYKNMIFINAENGGYYISEGVNAHFYKWTEGSSTNSPAEDFIDDFKHNEDAENEYVYDLVTISTSSKQFLIKETIRADWRFDVQSLSWCPAALYSESFSAQDKMGIEGVYYDEVGYPAEISDFNEDDASFVYKQGSGTAKYTLYGLFDAYVDDPRTSSGKPCSFYTESFENKNARRKFLYSTKTKITDESENENFDKLGTPKNSPNYKSPYAVGKSYQINKYAGFYRNPELGKEQKSLTNSELSGIKKMKDANGNYYFEYTVKEQSKEKFSDVFPKEHIGMVINIEIASVKVGVSTITGISHSDMFLLKFEDAVTEAEADLFLKLMADGEYVERLRLNYEKGVLDAIDDDCYMKFLQTEIE